MPLNRLIDSGISLPSPDVQRTTFSIDAMARFTCNTWDEVIAAQAAGDFDVVIVGAGMYGAYSAAKLFEYSRRMTNTEDAPRILVLESGPFLITEHVQNVTRRSTALGSLVGEDLVAPGQSNIGNFVKHSRCVGGKSLFWGGWSPRYRAADMQKLDQDGDRLWPEGVEDYLFQNSGQGGYAYAEQEIGVVPVHDFINGPLYAALKSRAEGILSNNQVPSLDAAMPPPIAVQAESPGSGLFSFDKYSSLPSLLDSVREDSELSSGNDAKRRLFMVPSAEVLKLETANGRVTQVVVALADADHPGDKSKARVVRMDLKSSAMILLAGNTINSTRLALNSFPRPATLGSNGELMGRNLMYHVRSNFVWRVRRDALNLPAPDTSQIRTAALHLAGSTTTGSGQQGQFHFQFYAAPNLDVPMFPGASRDPERFLYQMTPNIEDIESIREAQRGLGNDRVAVGIRTVGETFGYRSSPIGSNHNVSWMSVNPFGGDGDDVYYENGAELRVPKAYVHLVKTSDDQDVQNAQDQGALDFIAALTANASAPSGDSQPATVTVHAQIPEHQIPDNGYRLEVTPAGRFYVGRFNGFYRVLDALCTHEHCFVDWSGAQGVFSCPCHSALFGADGGNISGPPPSPLRPQAYRVQNGNLEIIDTQDGSNPVEYVGGGQDGIGTTYHEVGTLWMGTDPAKSVTDANGRFHHVANAYCVDQSLFPTSGSANPVLTGIALSRKIAESIIERYVSVDLAGLEPGFVRLYNGNFQAEGWQIATGGSDNFFDVPQQDYPVLGAGIDNATPATGLLWYTPRKYKDFVLRLDWRAFDAAANSGIFLRLPQPMSLNQGLYDSSIEVQIDENGYDADNDVYGSPLHKTGAVYGVFPARQWAAKVVQPRSSAKQGHWNSAEIKLQGQAIDVSINGVTVSTGIFPNLLAFDAPASGKTKRVEGFIGLQCHSEVVQFRNIRVKEL
jgi:choline dehydrogenase-like flavoprotein/Rieske Fe-S protein